MPASRAKTARTKKSDVMSREKRKSGKPDRRELAERLRENLRRRKAQARARSAVSDADNVARKDEKDKPDG